MAHLCCWSCVLIDDIVGEIAECMYAAGLKYGFLSTCTQTIFLKAEVVNGQITLLYSRVIQYNTVEQGGRATLLQCFAFFNHLASGQNAFQYTMPKNQAPHLRPPGRKWGFGPSPSRQYLHTLPLPGRLPSALCSTTSSTTSRPLANHSRLPTTLQAGNGASETARTRGGPSTGEDVQRRR